MSTWKLPHSGKDPDVARTERAIGPSCTSDESSPPLNRSHKKRRGGGVCFRTGLGDQSADAIAAVVIVWMMQCFRTEDRRQRRYPTARRRQRSTRVQSGDHREECAMAPACTASHSGSRGIRYRASPKAVRFSTSPLVSGLSGYGQSRMIGSKLRAIAKGRFWPSPARDPSVRI